MIVIKLSNPIKFSTFSCVFSKSKAEVIKKLNYENKALFGPVHKPKKTRNREVGSSTNNINNKFTIANECNNYNKDNENKISVGDNSEFYWLIESKNSDRVELISSQNPNTQKDKNSKLVKGKSSKSAPIKVETLSESLNNIRAQQHILSNHLSGSEVNKIPFDQNGLQSILNFPLIYDQNSEKKNNLLLNAPLSNLSSSALLTGSLSYKMPSVNKILQATMSDSARKALINWKLAKITELGQEGFNILQKELLQHGKLFHKALQDYLTTYEKPEIDSSIEKVWNSVQTALDELQPQTKLIEASVEHPYLKYCGIVDYVSLVRSNICVIEWKKSTKIKNNINFTYDAPVQLCAYLGALSFDSKYLLNAKSGYVIVAYTNGEPANVHYLNEIDLHKYWCVWLKRLQEYWIRYKDGTLPEAI